ncbi:hypothetical protein FHS83_000053 [Rhizomicrobium palustre]|uniref:Uncharacterized protein n=1 Tax=Rhizomicrobium palustre TaxID=189966 RepID=A0A846MU29_9PROT|nr:hypothetical protein [Rhizomicrobium palustre]NIK86735.1 hypothetical protein [Rhizomicrobium palustre]
MKKAILFLAAAFCVPAAAQEDKDLDLIPGSVANAAAPSSAAKDQGKYSLDDAFGWYGFRGQLAVPLSGGMPSRWANRLSFDGLDTFTLSPALSFTASDRLSLASADGIGFPNKALRNDIREAYFTYEAAPQTYLEAGRINLRYGVAYGYNPTDFFRSRTSVAQSSSDPGAQRLNRLGTVLLRGQHFFDGGAVELVYAPKLHSPVPLGLTPGPFDPKIDQTNGSDRLLAAFSFELEEFSPQMLVYYEGGRTKFGLNLSHPIGASVIAYASWAGDMASSATVDAFAFAKRTRTFPATLPVTPTQSLSRGFKNDLSVGANWSGEYKESITIEYNFHQAGFSQADWKDWFATGANPAFSQVMWYLRGYASDIQQPMSRHQAFVRADWAEPFHIEHADVGAYVMTNLLDGSSIGQISASYDLSDQWSLGIYGSGSIGGRKSEWGSLRGSSSVVVQAVRYF